MARVSQRTCGAIEKVVGFGAISGPKMGLPYGMVAAIVSTKSAAEVALRDVDNPTIYCRNAQAVV